MSGNWDRFTDTFFNTKVMLKYLPDILSGVVVTIELAVLIVLSGLLAGLALALLVPVAMIRDLIGERQARRNDAVHGIAEGWGRRQALIGPILAVP